MYEIDIKQSLRGGKGEVVVLESVDVETKLDNILCETTITQLYQNQEDKPIEAVYTFPLASTSVLLAIKVKIGGRELKGVVTEKKVAEEEYENAIVDGDRAIMLEQIQDGLYAMNVGNIQPEEKISIALTYSELLIWQENSLRYHLPTTIAPRYGDPDIGGMQPHQVPAYDLFTENKFKITLKISGALAKAKIECPSHEIVVDNQKNALVVTFASGESSMDRDFILNIEARDIEKEVAFVDNDGKGGYIAFASFVPRIPTSEIIKGKSIKIIVDCSGSMSGDSISQAKKAVSDILNQLCPKDYFNIILFGSSHQKIFNHQVKANKENISRALRLTLKIDANLGGTEIQSALQAAINQKSPELDQEILLITDGEVWNTEDIIKYVKKSNHRVFTVGVGSAVAEGFVQDLARETGGACELVSPREKMAEKIVRHFKRIYLPRAEKVMVQWPIQPDRQINKSVGQVFDGDTYYTFACFNERPEGLVTLDLHLPGDKIQSQKIVLHDWQEHDSKNNAGTIARMAMHHAIGNMAASEASQTAVFYQLISPFSNYLIIDEVAESQKDQALPELRKVSQMLAAGYGGTGRIPVKRDIGIDSCCSMECESSMLSPYRSSSKPKIFRDIMATKQSNKSILNTIMFSERCSQRFAGWFDNSSIIADFNDLRLAGFPRSIILMLEEILEDCGYEKSEDENLIILAFLHVFCQSVAGKKLDRAVKRLIKKAVKKAVLDESLVEMMTDRYNNVRYDDWNVEIFR